MTKPFRKDNLEIGDPSQYLSPEQLQPFDTLRERIEKGERLTGDDLQEYHELVEILTSKHRQAVIDFELETITAQHPVARFDEVTVDLYPAGGQAKRGIKAWIHKKASREGLYMLLLCDRDNILQFKPQDEVRVGGSSLFGISDIKRLCQDYAENIGPHHDILMKPRSKEETETHGEGDASESEH